MKAAIVLEFGQAPVYGDFRDPAPEPGKSVVRVTASALSQVTRSRASGTHYSGRGEVPFVPGVDATGITSTGERVYCLAPQAPFGTMAELCLVDDRHCIALPGDLDERLAAAIAIPGMSSWAALVQRASLQPGETVLINGATGTAGRLAVRIARHLGAGRIIVTGRRPVEELQALGGDGVIPLIESREELEVACEQVFRTGVDVVLDYLWGASAEALLRSAARTTPDGKVIRYVQIGSISARDITLPSAVLRSSALQLMGSGFGSVTLDGLLTAIRGVLESATLAGLQTAITPLPLSEVSRVWALTNAASRAVLVP